MSQPAIKLYRHPLSGHAHRVELMLSLLGVPTELVFVDLMKGAHKTPEFLALNRFGQVPVIDDNGIVLADSNAILVYLAGKYGNGQWLPSDPLAQAKVQRWLSVASGELARGSSVNPAQLREDVTSPGGTTRAALEVLMATDGLEPLIARAVAAAAARSRELAS